MRIYTCTPCLLGIHEHCEGTSLCPPGQYGGSKCICTCCGKPPEKPNTLGIFQQLRECKPVSNPVPINLEALFEQLYAIKRKRDGTQKHIEVIVDERDADRFKKYVARMAWYRTQHLIRKRRWLRGLC